MRSDRRVDAAVRAMGIAHDVVQGFTHAVQALEFETVEVVAGERHHRGAGMRIVGRELRVNPVTPIHQHLRAGHVTDIGVYLACEHRKRRHAKLLCQFHLGIPVSALDQAHHDFAVVAQGHVVEGFDHRCGALAVGLHHDTEPVPAGQRRIGDQGLDHVQRQIQAILFLGVDVEADVGGGGLLRQLDSARRQFSHDGRAVRVFVTRVQRGKLYRNARAGADIALRLPRDRANRLGVGLVITYRVRLGARRLAEHVVGIGITSLFEFLCIAQAFVDGLSEHELAAEQLHCLRHRGPNQRFADAPDKFAQRRCWSFGVVLEHLAGQHQCPGRGVDQR